MVERDCTGTMYFVNCLFGCCFKAMQCGATQPDDELVKTKPVKTKPVKTKPGKKISYEPPSKEKKSKKKEKTEEAEKLNEGKEQFEGKSLQLSELLVSSPALQTPTSSPVSNGKL